MNAGRDREPENAPGASEDGRPAALHDLRHGLIPEVFALRPRDTQERRRVALMLRQVLLVLISTAAILCLVYGLFLSRGRVFHLGLLSVGVLGAMYLCARGRLLGIAALGTNAYLLWLSLYGIATGEGIHDTAIMLFPILFLIATLSLPLAIYVLFAAIATGGVIVVGISEIKGWLRTDLTGVADPADVVLLPLLLVAAAVLVRFLTQRLLASMARSRDSEEALRQSEEKHRLFLENFDGIAYQVSHLTFRPFFFYGKVKQITGYEPEEFLARRVAWSDLIHPEDMPRVREESEQLRDVPGYVADNEYRIVARDGQVRWVRDLGRAIRTPDGATEFVQGAVYDITARKEAEEALRESEARFRAVFERAPLAIVLTRGRRLVAGNPAFCSIFGYEPTEIAGLSVEDITHPADVARSHDAIDRMDRGAVDVVTLEKRYLRKGGETFWGSTVATLVTGDSGGELYGLGLIADITARKEAEAERERLEQQLRQAQKMEAVGRLAGGVAHDFNNMLTAILGNAELALKRVDASGPLHEDLNEICKAAGRSADLTRQLLAFARKQMVAPRVLDLNETVSGMLKMLRRLIGEDVELAWSPGEGVWPVRIDPSQVDQILANLCLNARDAVDAGGQISIETSNLHLGEDDCVGVPDAAPGEYVVLSVSDNGRGMDTETLENLFEPFFTTKAVGEGTGLGLATVYGIVRQNGGFIRVYSELGSGATFHIHLPRSAAATAHAEAAPRHDLAAGGGRTVLLVEDEPSVLALGKAVLQDLGYEVLTAATPEEAIDLAERHDDIDLLLTDVVMPGMNGRELSERLMRRHSGLQRVFMSGYTADVIAHHGVLDERVHFIQKPFTRRTLAAKLREALGE